MARSGLPFSTGESLSDAEVVRAYQECDLVLFASTYEGFGLPIVEAQAVGRPVITSDILSMPEVAGGAARLVDPFSVPAIRGAVLELIPEPGTTARAYRSRI